MESEVIGVAQSDPVYPRDSTLVFVNGTLVEASGHSIDLFLDLAYILKFKPVMKKGAGWGDKLPNGSWSGISTQLLANDADICISQATLNVDRAEVFTFFQPTYLGNYLAHFRQIPSRSLRNVFLQPFHEEVWLLLLVASIMALLSLKLMYVFKFKNIFYGFPWYVQDFTMGKQYEKGSLSDLLLWIVGCISQKGWSLTPEGLGMKIVFYTTIITTTIVYVAYSANLVAIFKTSDTPITEFSTLRKQLKIIGDKSIPFITDIVQNSSRQKKRSSHQEFMALNDAVEEVLATRSAFLTVDGFFNAFLDSNRTSYEYCQQISTIKALKTTRWAGMYARRNWSKKEVFGRR
ncbi:unnamed protein product [Allacma fusca]|uniref:Uncharacterized protein n=1 Tax=Allacma fusca TaxID=39272 RepID=A0A8J2K399_9HEXA|nr:unnamed protein product [Allacma fusca]